MSAELCREFERGPARAVRAIRDAAQRIDAESWLPGTYWTHYELIDPRWAGATDCGCIVLCDDTDPLAAAVTWTHEYSHVCAWQRGGAVAMMGGGHTWVFAAVFAYFLARLDWLEPVRPLFAEMVCRCEDDQLYWAWSEGAAGLGPSWSMAERAADIGGRCWTQERLGGAAAMRSIIHWYNACVRGFDFAFSFSPPSPPRPTFSELTLNYLKLLKKKLKRPKISA